MEDEKLRRDYWYDIYGLSENRDAATVEAFLSHFADWGKISHRKRDALFLVPDLSIPEKHKLFESRYSFGGVLTFGPLAFGDPSRPKPETVRGVTVRQALALGAARKDQSFSLYVRNHTRKDVECLLVHFTVDGKVILGVAVNAEDASGKDNLPLAQGIRQELAGVVPIEFSTVWYEQYPPDSEAELMEGDRHLESLGGDWKKAAQQPCTLFPVDALKEAYYHTYRTELHGQYRELVYEPNLGDYYMLGDSEGQPIGFVYSGEDRLRHGQAWDPQAKEAVKLPYLAYLLGKAMVWEINRFTPATILRVSIPPGTMIEPICQGRRRRASLFTPYEGVRTTELTIEDTFHLDRPQDMRRLAEEGFFQGGEGSRYDPDIEAYEKWLVKSGHSQLYLNMLKSGDALLKFDAMTLLEMVGRQDWPGFLSYLPEFKVDSEDLWGLLREMCRSGSWSAGQVADILDMVSPSDAELEELMGLLSPHPFPSLPQSDSPAQSEIYRLLESRRKGPPSLSSLVSGMKAIMDKVHPADAILTILAYLRVIEREYGTFLDHHLMFRWATREAFQDILPTALKLLPEGERRSINLLNIGLVTGNDTILESLAFSPSDIEKIRQEMVARISGSREDPAQLIKSAACRGNYFQVAHLAPQVDPKDLVGPLLEACKEGKVGIVQVLVEQGRAAPDCFYNSPIKYANKGGFYLLRRYLLGKGVRIERF